MKPILFALPLLLLFGCLGPLPIGQYGSAHEHADFKVYIDGKAFDFTLEKYQSPLGSGQGEENCGMDTSRLAHLHNGDGDIAHKHATGVTWSYFFSTLGMNFTSSCLTLDTGEKYCNSQEKRWKFFVNRAEVGNLPEDEIHDLDQALFTYGALEGQLKAQLDSVTSKSFAQDTEGSCAPHPKEENSTGQSNSNETNHSS